MEDGSSKTHETRPTEVQRGEKATIKTINAIMSFQNLFDIDTKDKLVILSSGASASPEVMHDHRKRAL